MILLGCLSGAFIIWIPTVFAAAGDDVVASRKCAPGALYFQAQPVGVSVDIVSLYESASDSANLCATFCYSVATCKSAIFTVGFDEYPGRCRLTTTELGCDTELPQLNSFPENLTSIRYLALQCFECKENLIKNGSYPVTSYPSETAMNQSVTIPPPVEEATTNPFPTPKPIETAEWYKLTKKPDHKGLFSCPSALHYSFLPATEFTNFPSIVEISTTSVNSCVATCYSLPNCTATLYHISESDGVTYRRCRLFNADLNCNDDNPQVSDFPDGSVIEYLLVYCIECKKEAKNGTTVAVTTEQQISERIGHTKASATKSPLV